MIASRRDLILATYFLDLTFWKFTPESAEKNCAISFAGLMTQKIFRSAALRPLNLPICELFEGERAGSVTKGETTILFRSFVLAFA